MIKPLDFAKLLIEQRSITPNDSGLQHQIFQYLSEYGFKHIDLSTKGVTNSWIYRGSGAPFIIISGHTDVVPPGDERQWTSPPFEPMVKNNMLYGRGACDMKGPLAACVSALSKLNQTQGTIALALTSDEEGDAIHGSKHIVKWLNDNQKTADCTLVIEPTSRSVLGDILKNARRASTYLNLTIKLPPHHVAYLDSNKNPILSVMAMIDALSTEFTIPNVNFHLVDMHAGTASNVTPSEVCLKFNWRHPDSLTFNQVKLLTESIVSKYTDNTNYQWQQASESYYSAPKTHTQSLIKAIEQVCAITPQLSQEGGTSDGRFFAKASNEIIEFGPLNKSIHQVDEHICIFDLELLSQIYFNWLTQIFSVDSTSQFDKEQSAAHSK
tara:strand:- start:2655 stop:3800 length:1146 start_codon:yes stop_codon:yes gene_type:complete